MLRRSHRRFDFRSQKRSDISTAMIGRTRESGVDHVAVDMGAYLATGTNICRDLVGPERDAEVARFITKSILSVVLKKVRPLKSLAIIFDGSDPLWKVSRVRKVPNKSSRTRYVRSAGSPMPFVVEDRIRTYLAEQRATPDEFVISGAATPGPVESKLSAWLLDLAARPDVKRTETIALVGGSDLVLTTLGATPFHAISSVTIDRGDLKQTQLTDLLEWLTLGDVLRSGDNVALSRMRTDAVLLLLLSSGISATNLTGLPNLNFKDLMEAYVETNVAKNKYLTVDLDARLNSPRPTLGGGDAATATNDGGTSGDAVPFNASIGMDAHAVADLLARTNRRIQMKPKEDKTRQTTDHIELLLQSLAMVVDGGIRDHSFNFGSTTEAKPAPLPVERFVGHLKSMPANTILRCKANENFALTAAEQVIAGALEVEYIHDSLPAFTNGHSLPESVAQSVLAESDALKATEKIRGLLAPIQAKSAHRVFRHTPTHFWRRQAGEVGPPVGWQYASIDLGALSRRETIRGKANALSRSPAAANIKVKNALVLFDPATSTWEETDVRMPKTEGVTEPKLEQLKVVTWNVQFDRFSGQTTPLGKPGIDWCTKTRYTALSQVLSTTDADIIAMQETEPTWWEFLSRQPWVQKNYAFSCPMRGEPITPWGQVMLVHRRLPVTNMAAHNIPGYTGHTSVMPVCSVALRAGTTLNLCGIHLLAPYSQANINVRVTQIETLLKRLAPKNVGEEVVVMGDFNDYPANFFAMPAAMGDFRDAWVEKHGEKDGDAGYTINGRTSKYTSLIIEPEFFGRADRVLFKSKLLEVEDAKLLGTKSVREEMGIASCPEYLFPSDHYGILTTLRVKHQ